MKPSNTGYDFDDTVRQYRWDEHGLVLTEIPDTGVVVEQNGRAYLAKHISLSSETIAIFEIGMRLGYTVAIQQGHPKTSNLLPYGEGVGYLSLAKSYKDRWAISIYKEKKVNSLHILINKRYQKILTRLGVHFNAQQVSRDHPEVLFLDVLPALHSINNHANGEFLKPKTILDKLLYALVREK